LHAMDRAFAHWRDRLASGEIAGRGAHARRSALAASPDAYVWLSLAAFAWMQPALPQATQASALLALWPLLHAAMGLGQAAARIRTDRALAACHDSLMEQALEPKPARSPTHVPRLLDFAQLHFTYPGTGVPVLQDLSFRVAHGEFIAIT